jgi:protein TonB
LSPICGRDAAGTAGKELLLQPPVSSSTTGDLLARRPAMFESTLEAQALHEGERRFGTLSAAALAHAAVGATIVAVTAFIVPPVRPPELPPVVVIVSPIPKADVTPQTVRALPPKKGRDDAQPARALLPPRDAPPTPPVKTPDLSPVPPPDDSLPGPDQSGDRSGGTNGDSSGVTGGSSEGDAGGIDGQGAGPVYVTGDMVRPVLLLKGEPAYPQAARRAGLGGRVTLRAVIAEDGSVESVEVFSSTNSLFDDAAVDAVRKWRYRPALMNGRPVRVYFSVVVSFIVR